MFVAACLLAASSAFAADAPVSTGLQAAVEAFRAGLRAWDGPAMASAIAALEALPAAAQDAYWRRYWLAVARTQYLLNRRGAGDARPSKADTDRMAEEALAGLREALAYDGTEAGELHGMLGLVLGVQINERPWSALWLGPRLRRHMKRAVEAEHAGPRAEYLIGAGMIKRKGATPEDLREGVARLEQAARLFDAERQLDREPWQPRWGYDHTLLLMAQAHEQLGDFDKALACYQAARNANPRMNKAGEGYERCKQRSAERK